MTDQPTPPAPETKDAVPAGSFTKPEHKKLTFGQQLGIWVLIIIVGVVFGIGSSVSLVFAGGSAKIDGDVSETDVIPRLQTMERLERVLNPRSGMYQPKFMPPYGSDGRLYVARELRVARLAESKGLMPKGQALDKIESEFLATPLEGSAGRTYHDALREHAGGADQIQRDELRRFLAERAARQGLYVRSAVAPVVPRDIGTEAYTVLAEHTEVAAVVLSGERLMPAVKPDDPEIESAYQQLRAQRFQRPVGVSINLAVADSAGLAAGIEVSEADAKAWYDGHQADFKDGTLSTPGMPAVTKPFDQVKEQAITAVRNDRATTKAEGVAERFSGEVDVLDGDKDPTKFAAAAKKAGLAIEDIAVEDHTPGTIDLGKHGTLKDLIGIFGKEHEAGFISRPAQTSTGAWVVIRLASRREAGFQDLDAVRPQVARYLSGRRAWKPLLAEAAKLSAAIKGPGALAAWAATPDGAAWGAKAANQPMSPTATLATPPAEADGQPGDPALVAKLAMPDRPCVVALVQEQANPYARREPRPVAFNNDVPQVRLVQVAEVKPADLAGIDRQRFADMFRGILGSYSESLLSREINQQLEKR